MKQVILVGAGGLARDLYFYLKEDSSINIKGILVDYHEDYLSVNAKEPYLGKIRDYKVEKEDFFIIGIGENPGRELIYNILKKNKANFYTFIHPSSIVHPDTIINESVIIGPFCIIGSNCFIGENVFINKFCNVGHDCKIQKNSLLFPYAMVGGKAIVGRNVVLSTRSTITPRLTIGDNCKISAHSFLRKDLEKNSFFYNKNEEIIKEIT